jgi:hypothetical protein
MEEKPGFMFAERTRELLHPQNKIQKLVSCLRIINKKSLRFVKIKRPKFVIPGFVLH